MCHRGPAPGRQSSLITAMRIRDQEFLLQSGATDHLQQISGDTSDLHQPNVRVLPSIDMQGQDGPTDQVASEDESTRLFPETLVSGATSTKTTVTKQRTASH